MSGSFGSDVRMIQGCKQLGFTLETCYTVGILREFIRQHLYGHVSAVLHVLGLIDYPIPPLLSREVIL